MALTAPWVGMRTAFGPRRCSGPDVRDNQVTTQTTPERGTTAARSRDASRDGSTLPAVALLLASIGFITLVDTTAKFFTTDLHGVQLVWGYFVGITISTLIFLTVRRQRLAQVLRSRRPGLQMLRAGALATSISLLFVGLTYLPIADATVLSFMAPLFITALSGPLLGERIGWHRWLAVLAGLAGVLFIVRPGGDLYHWASVLTLLGAVSFAVFQIMTRKLSMSDSTMTTLLYTALGGLLWTSIAVVPFWREPAAIHWVAFLGTGVLGFLAHLCMIRAFTLAQASLLAPFNYSKLIWAAIAGYVVFGDIPGVDTLVGSAAIIGSGLYVVYRERRRR